MNGKDTSSPCWNYNLPLVFAHRAVRAAHSGLDGTTPFAFQTAGTVNMFPGGSLETAIAIGSRTAIDTTLFVMVMLMKPIGVFRTTLTVFC